MGHSFADVRVHTDSRAHDLTRRAAARAFTVKNNLFFAPGEFQPETPDGRRLLAHELTHVVQQGASGVAVQREPMVIQRAAHPCARRWFERPPLARDRQGVVVFLRESSGWPVRW